jgi:hypothetical protein
MGDPKPTRNQVAAVLHALADHTGIVNMLMEASLLGDARARELGEHWRLPSGLGRYFQDLGDALETPRKCVDSGPTG